MMRKKIIKKLLAVMMIITILATDFFVLGSGLITYATQVTNEIEGYPNIHFSTYFKEGENDVKQINKNVKDKEIKLYAKIGVNSDVDCLENIKIKLADNNFNIISTSKGTLEENTVTLDYIAAGSSTEIELNIEPIFSDKISADMLLKTNLELNAKYKHADAPEGEDIQATSECIVKYQPDETTKAELTTDIITNKVLAVDGTNQRVIQALIKSRLTNNEYPVKQTTLNITIPKLGENTPEVSVLAIGKLATNGLTEINSKNYKVEDGKLQITLNNEVDENNQISWNKNAYDEIVVTYIYPETVDASEVEITSNSEIKLHSSGNTYTARYTKGIKNQELNNVIMGRTEITTTEMYKGELYANIDAEYTTKTSIIVTNANVEGTVAVYEGPDVLETAESELPINTKYITTKINLEKMLYILGEYGSVEITNGETKTVVNKDSAVDAEGNVVINHENSTSKLDITTSKPINAGVLEINHIKTITENTYTREELKEVKTLKAKGSETDKSTIELKETVSKAELTMSRTTFSATESNELTLGIKLITDGAKYDLYKNPSIVIKFPETVANVEFVEEPNKLYADEFTITNKSYDASNKTITINMAGEQIAYPESELTQGYIQLKLKVTLSQFVMAQTDKIVMAYINEKASQYENEGTYGIIEQPIEISAPRELIKIFNLSSNTNTSLSEKILQQVKSEDAGKEFDFNIGLVNNKDTELNDVKVLGKLPTAGNTITGENENTLEITLKEIVAQNAKIYYTENANATEDIENVENGWTQTLLANAKMYLIKIDNLARGEKYTATVKVQLPESINENAISFTQYEVLYDSDADEKQKEESRKIGVASSVAASIKVATIAQVGKDNLVDGDTVKEGEVIKYTVTAKNAGIETLTNVNLQLDIPEGTVFVKPIEKCTLGEGSEQTVIEKGGYVYVDGAYYEEITNSEQLSKFTNITIPELSTTDDYTVEYEVRVNKGTAGNEILNKPTAIYNGALIEVQEVKNTVKEANIRVTVKRAVDVSTQLLPTGKARYTVYVENMSDSTIKNLEMQINAKGFKVETINDNEELSEETKIDEIKPKEKKSKKHEEDYEDGMKSFIIYGNISDNIEEMSICVTVKDSNGEEYRSNMVVETLPYINGTINMTSPQNGQYIKEGDTVEYNITVKNTSDIEGIIKISDVIPEYLQVKSVYENKELKLEETDEKSISNNINYSINLKPQEETQVDIVANVGYIPESYHGKAITNMANIKVLSVAEANSQIVTHILKSSTSQDENVANVISGMIWLDINENGQKDSDEKILSGASVKLYDTLSEHYVTDEYGNPVEIITESDGEYIFTKIPAGLYKIFVEYDSETYEFILNDLKENVFNMNLGLNENNKYIKPKEENPQKPENSTTNGETEKPGNTQTSEEEKKLKTVSGYAWLDSNRDGRKDDDEIVLSDVRVKIYDVTNQKTLAETTTDENGKYEFTNIEKGSYVLIFEYNTEEYEPTIYMAEGVETTRNSKVVLNNININGQQVKAAVTDTIDVQNDVNNINIGLKESVIFDLELNKYVSKIVVQTSEKTKQYDYDKKTLAKTEIHRKQIQGAVVVLEYTITVKNTGEISGYAKNIVDYLPSGLTFSSELNKDWYLSGSYLYTKSLENVEIKPGEEKEVKLVLTKTMTNENVGLINNRAEIYEDYNKYGESDIDSISHNQAQNEDDFGSADVIIQVATGGGNNITYITLLLINAILIGFAIKLMMKNHIIKRPTNRRRRRK